MKAKRTVVVAAVDRTESSDAVVQMAPAVASAMHASELHFVHVLGSEMPQAREFGPPVLELEDGRRFLDDLGARAARSFAGRIVGRLVIGPVRAEILRVLEDLEADLLVVGTEPKGALHRLVSGSVSRSLARTAPCAVLVARPNRYPATPAIEPPCPACVSVRNDSGGTTLWCQQHAAHRPPAHLHYELPSAYRAGSMFIRTDGGGL